MDLEKLSLTKNVNINIGQQRNVDQMCSTILLKIYLTLEYNCEVRIISNIFLGNELFPINKKPFLNKQTDIWINSVNKEIIFDNQKNGKRKVKIKSITISDYIFTLIYLKNFVIDKELIGFYTILSLKYNLDNKKYNEIKVKLLNILTDNELNILDSNVEKIIDNISNFMV